MAHSFRRFAKTSMYVFCVGAMCFLANIVLFAWVKFAPWPSIKWAITGTVCLATPLFLQVLVFWLRVLAKGDAKRAAVRAGAAGGGAAAAATDAAAASV